MAAVAGQQSEKLSPAEFQQLQDLAACKFLVILILILIHILILILIKDKDKDKDSSFSTWHDSILSSALSQSSSHQKHSWKKVPDFSLDPSNYDQKW